MILTPTLKSFLTSSSALVGYQLTVCMPFVICAVFIGHIGSSLSLAAYGLANTVMNMGFNGIIMGVQESLGVVCSRLYGAQQYKDIWRYLWKSIVIAFMLSVLFSLFSIYSKGILTSIGVEEDVAIATHRLLKRASIALYFQGINQVTNNFLSAQQVTKPLFYLNFISILIIYLFAHLFIGYMQLAEIGFAYTKICQEIFNSCYYLLLIVQYLDKSYFEAPSFDNIKENFWDFLLLNAYTTLSFYGECIAFEINIYYAALLHNVDALATWVTYINYTAFHYFISVGFGTTIRNLVGKRIGELKIAEARDESILYFKYIGIFSVVIIILQTHYREAIAMLFTNEPNIVLQLKENIALYSFSVFSTFIFPGLNTLYRVVNKERFMFWSNVVAYPLSLAIFNWLFCFSLGLGIRGINLGFVGCKVIVSGILAWYLYTRVEWKYLKQVDDIRSSFHEDLIERSISLNASIVDTELLSRKGLYS